MYCLSVSYKSADLDFRKKLSFSEEDCKKITSELLSSENVSECVMLCTCNRTEVYFCGEKGSEKTVQSKLAESAGINGDILSRHLLFFSGDNAVLHLFKVACGIESMVIGEDEILGQTKNAYYLAKENKAVSYELNMTFLAAISCAKKIKTKTKLSKTSVSVATLAANEASKLGKNVDVLVIGASGKIGTTVLKNLASNKNIRVKAAFRKYIPYCESFNNTKITAVDYGKRYEYINSSDCIISATSSPHYTITLYDLKQNVTDKRKRLFIDLAVPPDIESSITELENVSLIDIDYFEKLAKKNNDIKLGCIGEAEEIISEEINTLKKDMFFHDFMPKLNDCRENSAESIIYKMKSKASASAFKEFLEVLSGD